MAKRRWVVKYDRKNECWCAWPADWPLVRGAWAFETWQAAIDYANSNGKLKSLMLGSPVRFD